MENTKINVLGTEYHVMFYPEGTNKRLEDRLGFCDYTAKIIGILELTTSNTEFAFPKTMQLKVLRHEIIHAFLYESGLGGCACYDSMPDEAHPELMVDWFAMQHSKINKVFAELGIL